MASQAVAADVDALERQLEALDALPEPARSQALDAISGVLALYGEALGRIAARLPGLAELADDEVVASVLMLHDLHPATVEERVLKALDEVRPYMGSHGGGVELAGVVDGVALVKLEGTCSGCAASTVTLKLAIEEAVLKAVPEVHAVESVEKLEEPAAPLLQITGPDGKPLECVAPS